ncbi:MAG: Hsp20/alpha crystallin family protein [Nanoarchaeota archaeon]|nr:Hsp20/alpha crystallin family protein [Nanoarchaeota archaeon]
MKKEKPVEGLLSGLFDFLKTIEKLQEEGKVETRKEFTTPSGSKGMFEYKVRAGEGLRERPPLGMRPGRVPIHPRKVRGEEVIAPEEAEKEHLVDVFEEKGHTKVVMELPNVKEKDINFKIKNDVLKITAKTTEGKIEKDVKVPKDMAKIENVSFKNNILEIKLKKKR